MRGHLKLFPINCGTVLETEAGGEVASDRLLITFALLAEVRFLQLDDLIHCKVNVNRVSFRIEFMQILALCMDRDRWVTSYRVVAPGS